MLKYSFEKLDDWYINFYEQWLFVKCFEYSALLLWELFWYRVYPNIDKKTWLVFLEIGFPKVKLWEVVAQLEWRNYSLRITNKDQELEMTIWTQIFQRDKQKLIDFKTKIIKW